MPWMAAAAGGASLAGGIMGYMASKDAMKAAQNAAAAAAAQYNGIVPPEVKQLILEEYKRAGTYTPEMEDAFDAGVSQYQQVQENPEMLQAQKGALEMLRQRSATGLGPEDRAALNQVRGEVQRDAQAKNEQIKQDMQARGLGGSGSELAMQLAASQESAGRSSEEADRLAAQASQNALAALSQYTNQANSLQGQDLGLQSAKAQAADEMNRFNVQNKQAAESANTQYANQGQMYNLDQDQAVANANTQQSNSEQTRQEEAKQSRFGNQMALASGRANALNNQANNYMQQGQNTAQMWSGVGSGVGAGFSGLSKYLNSKPSNKADTEDKK